MNINISFVHKAEPCSEKPKGCYETYLYCFMVRLGSEYLRRQIRDLKKMIWRKCEIKEKIQKDLFALLSGKE